MSQYNQANHLTCSAELLHLTQAQLGRQQNANEAFVGGSGRNLMYSKRAAMSTLAAHLVTRVNRRSLPLPGSMTETCTQQIATISSSCRVTLEGAVDPLLCRA